MYRRTGVILFLVLGVWAAWIWPKDVTYIRGKSVNYELGTVSTVHVHCGKAVPILFDGEFGDGVPATAFHMQGECRKAARSHIAWVILLGGGAIASLVIGLMRGPAPRVPGIDTVLERLPTPAEMREEEAT